MQKCPHCKEHISSVRAKDINVIGDGGATFVGNGYTCPRCFVIISVAIDPIAIKTDIINGIKGR